MDKKINKVNYEKIMQQKIAEIKKSNFRPKLLLHICCAPCASGVLEELSEIFELTIFFYNPNIDKESEYLKRVEEAKRFIENKELNIKLITTNYDPKNDFYNNIKGLEQEKEGGKRCYKCYEIRLNRTAEFAKKMGYDYFTTVLSISPLKNAEWINEIGENLQDLHHINFLNSDFKKKGRYGRSIQESRENNLYRQDYCGCIFSKIEREKIKKIKKYLRN